LNFSKDRMAHGFSQSINLQDGPRPCSEDP
jgi:hypothetical protein